MPMVTRAHSLGHQTAFRVVLVLASVWLVTSTFAQERLVPVYPGSGTLNNAIAGDTTASGERIEPENTVYLLMNGGYYLLSGSIDHSFPLSIRAPSGAQAQLVPAVVAGGSSSRPFRSRNDITLKNLYVTGRDEAGGLNSRIVRVSTDSATVVIDSCHFDFDAQAGIRLDNDWASVQITNSVFSNIGRGASLDNGRVIDTRGNEVESIILQNSTFYNITSRVIRDGGGFIKLADVRGNTFFNVAEHGISFGEIQELTLKNNLFYNTGLLGRTGTTFVDRVLIGVDSLSPGRIGPQILDIRFNDFVTSPDVVAAWPDSVSGLPLTDSLGPAHPVFVANSLVNNVETRYVNWLSVPPAARSALPSVPNDPTDVIDALWEAVTAGLSQDDIPEMDDGNGGALPADTTLPFNFAFASDPSSTRAQDGGPLGDRNWLGFGNILPVEMTRLAAMVASGAVVLEWSTATETNNAGFSIERAVTRHSASVPWDEVGFVAGAGTTTESQFYRFQVDGLEPGYQLFRLKQVDFDGAFEYSEEVEVLIAVADDYALEPAYPNPFNPSTTVRFAVGSEQHVVVSLIDVMGRTVQELYRGEPVPHEMQAIRVDASGMASGMYHVVIKGEQFVVADRITLLR